jgi:uncharacterized protein YbjQ (UPF0145 family)
MLIVTTSDIPGFRVTRVHGDVLGLSVLSLSDPAATIASFPAAADDVDEQTRQLTETRGHARGRMWDEARGRGANAVIGMRYDSREIGGTTSEVAAYGTAVTVEPVNDSTQSTIGAETSAR